MKGAILYTPDDAEKNIWFIDSFIKASRDRGCSLKLCTSMEDIPEDIDFAVNRSRSHKAAAHLEDKGIIVFNSSFVSQVSGDKWDTYRFFSEKLPMAETYPAQTKCPIGFPCIVKPRHGHGGQDVYLVNDQDEYIRAAEKIYSTEYFEFTGEPYGEEAIVQPALDRGRDMRVYIIGNKITASVLRSRTDDFRSNFSLGGKAELTEAGPEITEMVKTLCDLMDFGFAGLDFIFDKGIPVLNEIEDAAGSRMLYSLKPDTDIPGLFMDHILKELDYCKLKRFNIE